MSWQDIIMWGSILVAIIAVLWVMSRFEQDRNHQLLINKAMQDKDYTDQYIQAKHQKIAALENELAKTMKDYIALTDIRVRLSNRIQELEAVVANQNYFLKQYEVTMADPKALAAFIRWQAERRQQDQLLEVLTGGQSKQPTAEESLELAEDYGRRLIDEHRRQFPLLYSTYYRQQKEDWTVLQTSSELVPTSTSPDTTPSTTSGQQDSAVPTSQSFDSSSRGSTFSGGDSY